MLDQPTDGEGAAAGAKAGLVFGQTYGRRPDGVELLLDVADDAFDLVVWCRSVHTNQYAQ